LKRVLLVDDMHAIRALLRVYLVEFGFEFVELRSGEEALASVKEQRPSLIIMDHVMPGLSGMEVLQVLRGDPAFADIPVIILTADETLDTRLTNPRTRFSKKPIRPDALKGLIRQVLALGEQS
jgi:CheY-like chemotaxis protein